MKILIACEESQTVCKEFRARGHEAFSCDIQMCSGGHPEWHIQGDVLQYINGDCNFFTVGGGWHSIYGPWNLMIAHPPCTDLAASGAKWFREKQMDFRQQKACVFFMRIMLSTAERIAVENPVGIMSTCYRKPDQIIHPWMFGDNFSKQTCLWLKNLPKLVPDVTEQPKLEYWEWVAKDGKKKKQPKWYFDALHLPPEERARVRSKTFPGIAKAMAEQWGNM